MSLNSLVRVPAGLGKLDKLRVLNLEGNQLHSLPPGLGQLRLTELRCVAVPFRSRSSTVLIVWFCRDKGVFFFFFFVAKDEGDVEMWICKCACRS